MKDLLTDSFLVEYPTGSYSRGTKLVGRLKYVTRNHSKLNFIAKLLLLLCLDSLPDFWQGVPATTVYFQKSNSLLQRFYRKY